MHERIRAGDPAGVTTARLDRIGRDVLDARGAMSNFLGYHGFPAVICASPNEVIVHGIPSEGVCWTTATSCRSIAAPSSRAGTAMLHSPRRWPGGPELSALIDAAEAALAPASRSCSTGNVWETSAMRSSRSPRRRLLGGPGIHRTRHRPGDARTAERGQLGHAGHGRPDPDGERVRGRADAEPRRAGAPWCSTTTGASSPPTVAGPPTSNTRSPSPPDGPRSSRLP